MSLELSRRYAQRRAFVTGAASGLGRALCRLLSEDGWTVGMADVDTEGLDDAAAEMKRAGGRPHVVELDVSDAAAFEEAATAFVEAHGGVDLVINNAGLGAGGRFKDTSVQDWERVVSVNLMGVVHGCRSFLPHLEDGGGHLINVASIAAVAAGPRMSVYNVSKAGVQALSETLYGEYHDRGVHVSVVMPSFFETNIAEDLVGAESAQTMTKVLIERSGLTAEEVARHALEEAGQSTIHVIYPTWMSRIIWYWKRLFPTSYVRSLPKREAEARKFDD